jgi:RNA polymerase sigma factor (sigma-70 family)
MTNRLWETAIERAGVLAAPLALDELSDADLVRRFLATREEPAFAAIVRRHGPLVWGVCRHLLPSEADAEDAFQATFLALVRGAGRISRPSALAAWLHRVAGRVCRNSLRALARRKRHERSAAVAESACPVDGATWDRWQTSVHEEIDRLPDSLRVPFLLCVLQGVRQPEAARRLGWKLGTVSGRVCKAKQTLTDALTRRGLTGAAVMAGLVGIAGPLSAGLVGKGTAVVRPGAGPGGGISTRVCELARGATGGFMGKAKLLAAAVLTATLTIGVGSGVLSTADAQSAAPKASGQGSGDDGGRSGATKFGAAPPAATGGGGRGMPSGGSMATRGPRVEYQFVARPKGAAAFKSLLTKQGADGWEYAGLVPGDDEMIFLRTTRSGGVMNNLGGGMGMPMGGGFSGFGAGQANPFAMPGGIGDFFGGNTPARGGRAPKAGGADSGGTPATGGGIDPAAGGPAAPKPPPVTLQTGETMRHKSKTNQTIDRAYSDNSQVVEVTLDPTDPRRVLIRGVAPGGARIELTDANGVKERHTVRVR